MKIRSQDSHPFLSRHYSTTITIMLVSLLFLLLPSLLSAQQCHPDEQNALLEFKNSFTTPNPFPSWDVQFACCNWYGVQCNEATNYVTGLEIIGDANGTIPTSVAKLKHLTSLRLHKMPNLVGQIPPEIGQLPQLRYLSISWTNISGPVPHFLANLKNLRFLLLPFNLLSGPIPPSIATLPYLYAIDLSRNMLTGPIPESFGYLKASDPPGLDLSHNMLSGEVPASLANVNFSSVDVSRNNLSGDASVFFGEGKATNTIVISRNNFEFDFSKVRFTENLDVLDISHNRIYGSIPKQITEAVFLQFLNVTYNRLCGEIPTGWKLRYRRDNFDSSSFVHNRCLCGAPLDPCK